MRQRYLENKKVRDVLRLPADNRFELFGALGIRRDWIEGYVSGLQPFEEFLASKKIVALTSYREISLLDKRHTSLQSSSLLLRKLVDDQTKRTLPVYFVLGPSGSGKTFFAVKDVAPFKQKDTRVTIYMKPEGHIRQLFTDPSRLVDWIKGKLVEERNVNVEHAFPLNMDVTLVVDEAAAIEDFRRMDYVTRFCKALEKLCPSTRLVVCGTGLDGAGLGSTEDVDRIRMPWWTAAEVKAVLHKSFSEMSVLSGDAAVNALLDQPTLKALSTNARSAYFLLHSVNSLHKLYGEPTSWVTLLRYQTPSIVDYVVKHYIDGNGLKDVNSAVDRFRLAASVFCALEAGRNKQTENVPQAPEFLDLPEGKLRRMAKSLVDLNVEYQDQTWKYISENVRCAAFVSPAIVIILCSLMGVSAEIMTNWGSQELIAALYAHRKHSLELYEKSLSGTNAIDQQEMSTIVRLVTTIPAPRAKDTFQTPKVPRSTVFINGSIAAFADVIAPYELYQSKHSSLEEDQKQLQCDLSMELWKCGLLNGQQLQPGRMALRGLLSIWSGMFDDQGSLKASTGNSIDDNAQVEALLAEKLGTDAFPLNLLDTASRLEETEYATILKIRDKWMICSGRANQVLPDLVNERFDVPVRFILSTDIKTIKLMLDTTWHSMNPTTRCQYKVRPTSEVQITVKIPDDTTGRFNIMDQLPENFHKGLVGNLQIEVLIT